MTILNKQNIVFMPGLDGTGLSFGPLLPFIPVQTNITIVRYPTDELLSFEETVQCAARQIPAGSSPVVIAESFSGPIAVQMIASGLIQARALVLCATFAKSPHPVAWRMTGILRLPLLIRPDMPKLFFRIIIGNDKLIADLLPLWRKVHADVPARIMDHRLGIINSVDVTISLKKLSMPCLYLQATDDRVVPSSCLAVFKRGIPHLEVHKIRAPHFILQAKPELCIRAIHDFLKLKSIDRGM